MNSDVGFGLPGFVTVVTFCFSITGLNAALAKSTGYPSRSKSVSDARDKVSSLNYVLDCDSGDAVAGKGASASRGGSGKYRQL
jgi:hypothetical protein